MNGNAMKQAVAYGTVYTTKYSINSRERIKRMKSQRYVAAGAVSRGAVREGRARTRADPCEPGCLRADCLLRGFFRPCLSARDAPESRAPRPLRDRAAHRRRPACLPDLSRSGR